MIYDTEVLKFDCFGGDRGHYHIDGSGERYYFEEKSVEAQIDRALLELRQNIRRHLCSSSHAKVRDFPLDSDRWDRALTLIKDKMLEYAVKAS